MEFLLYRRDKRNGRTKCVGIYFDFSEMITQYNHNPEFLRFEHYEYYYQKQETKLGEPIILE